MSLLGNKPITLDRLVRMAVSAGVVFGGFWLLAYLSDVLTPFVIALLLAYILQPVVRFLHTRLRSLVGAVALTLVLFGGVVTGLIMLIGPLVVAELRELGILLEAVLTDIDFEARATRYFGSQFVVFIKEFFQGQEYLALLQNGDMAALAEDALAALLPGIAGVFTGVWQVVIGLLTLGVVALYLVFILLEYDKLRSGWPKLVPYHYRRPAQDLVHNFRLAMNNYFRGQALVASIVGVLFATGFSIIGLPLGIVFGLFVGLLNLVPYLQIISLLPALLLALLESLQAGTPVLQMLGATALVYVVVQVIQDGFLVPRIMGKAIGLSPAIILLALSIWGKLLGVFGLLIALPLTYLMWVYYQRALAKDEAAERGLQLPGIQPTSMEHHAGS